MTLDRKRLGEQGEKQAADYLKQQGFTIVETNFSTRFAEIDIIALENSRGVIPKVFQALSPKPRRLCFVEVKTRTSMKYGRAALAVTPAKQEKIILAAQAFLQSRPQFREHPLGFDVVEVYNHQGHWEIHHIPHAFQCN
ncbi:MAG: YraN family protein [Desulfobacterales bacterium]|nr:YraN family protein [Desulfobacterales bacterium]